MNYNLDYPFPRKDDTLCYHKGEDTHDLWKQQREKMFPYIEGHKHAADMLWKQIEKNADNAVTQELIHPFIILECMHIKITLRHLIHLGSQITQKRILHDHYSLSKLWEEAKEMIIEIGGSDETDISAMEKMIKQFECIKGASFAFDYAVDRQGRKKELGLDWDNLKRFRRSIEKMSKYLVCGCMYFKSIINPADPY